MSSRENFYAYVTALNPEVTGSCLPVCVRYPDERKSIFLVECGLFQEREYNDLNNMDFPFESSNIEFVLITHNHADHIGKLPILCKYGFSNKIYATEATTKLMPVSLGDSYQIMKDEAKWRKEKPFYDERDVKHVIENLEPCKIGEQVDIDENIKVTFFDNGHIPGAAMILVQISYPGEKDINLFFTGDYKPYNLLKTVQPMPEWVYELPINVVIESTYGDTETSEIRYNFEEDVEHIIKEGKNLFIPVLAQGRTQDILYILKQMQEIGKISEDIPIYLDGNLAHLYTMWYKSGNLDIDEDKLDFIPKNFHFVDKNSRQGVITSTKQRIVLTTSGMLDHGPAKIYLPYVITSKNWAVFLTSYCAPGTLGQRILDPKTKTISNLGEDLKIVATIYWTNQFSSHGRADESMEFLSGFKNLRLVLITHGNAEVKERFAFRIEDAGIAKRVEVLGQHTIKLSHYGFIKAMGSKIYSTIKVAKNKKKNTHKKSKKNRIFCRRSFWYC